MMIFIWGNEEQNQIKSLLEYATAHQIPSGIILLAKKGLPLQPIGDNPEFCRVVSGFKVVFSIEDHGTKVYKHLSISSPTPGRVPNESVIDILTKALGFEKSCWDCHIWFEDIGVNHKAVNILGD